MPENKSVRRLASIAGAANTPGYARKPLGAGSPAGASMRIALVRGS